MQTKSMVVTTRFQADPTERSGPTEVQGSHLSSVRGDPSFSGTCRENARAGLKIIEVAAIGIFSPSVLRSLFPSLSCLIIRCILLDQTRTKDYIYAKLLQRSPDYCRQMEHSQVLN